ncbi:hypothetical protein Syun_024081 [Stephania yunnanensis]|uniref:Peroxisomal membrane protein PEX14 n=1 Tax=Stephania yunnanensis TaxID=152371 RepID=A0AAP0FA44_9MAGN
MASESAPSNPSDENPQPTPEPMKPMSGNGAALREEGAGGGVSQKSVFVKSEPIREDQVQNAVKFLSHPSVRNSPVIHRRSFLERKGLTKEEIDEAFCRVPDPTPSATTTATQAANPNQGVGQSVATNAHLQVPTQALAAAPTGVVSTVKGRFNWSYAFAAIGVLCCTGAGSALLLKSVVIPKIKNWIRKIVLEDEEGEHSIKKINSGPSLAEEAAAAAKSAAAAAADVARASQDMLNSKNEERKYFEALVVSLNAQVEEMKLMSSAIQKLEAKGDVSLPLNKQMTEVYSSPQYGKSAVPPSSEPSVAPPPKSYMEIMAMLQRGEKLPGIKAINDLPPNPNQPPSKPFVAPRSKPWEAGQYIRRQDSNSSTVENGMSTSQLNGDTTEPWWQQKNVEIREMESDDDLMVSSQRAKATQSSWVPPQPPPISMPEAVAAIRQPKSSILKEQSVEDQATRITERSESRTDQETIGVNGHSNVQEIEVKHLEKDATEEAQI